MIEISELNTPELLPYKERSEVQLYRWNEPAPGFFVAESPNVILRALADGYEPVSFLTEKSRIGHDFSLWEKYPDVPVYTAEEAVLKEIIGFQLTRGTLCLMRRRELPSAEELCRGKRRIAVLEEVMNPTNVGAIFRSAAALGVEAVLLTKGCSDPLYRRAARVSMGTVFQVPWTRISGERLPEELRSLGFVTAAMALSDRSVSIDHPALQETEKLAIILGTEGEGLKQETISSSDYTVKIPMTNGVDSLNVAAASAVAFWQLCTR
ncbi:MAG: RNA methyltransferase [Lachnospiraceae bacterium]|nr:RNA methyltransferase [Lachnospiraceae bacterium]